MGSPMLRGWWPGVSVVGLSSLRRQPAGHAAGSDRRRNLSSENRNSELACLFAFEKFQPGSAEPQRREGICLAAVGWGHALGHGETKAESGTWVG